MGSATTIVFARADLSIPGAPVSSGSSADHADTLQTRFFDLVIDSNPDIIVLDFSTAPRSGTDTILSIRRRCAVPILVVCGGAHATTEEYRIAGAAECIFGPIDVLSLHRSIQRILRVTRRAMPLEDEPGANSSVGGMDCPMQRKSLSAAAGPL